jgi:hypothetical protein
MPCHQFSNSPAPYLHPPPCTSIVLDTHCLLPLNPSLHSNKNKFPSHQALQLFVVSHWKCLSRWVSSCRSLPIPTTHMNYNFPDTFLVPSFCAGLCTRPFSTPVLGASRKRRKRGTKQPVPFIYSFPPSSPYACLTFAVACTYIFSSVTSFLPCLHTNPTLSPPLFFKQNFGFVPFPVSFRALFCATGASMPPLPSHTSLLYSLSFLFLCRSVPWSHLFLSQKQTLSE